MKVVFRELKHYAKQIPLLVGAWVFFEIMISRLTTIRDAQKILYMQDGDILEAGTHDELMAKNGLYAALYNSQFAENNEA